MAKKPAIVFLDANVLYPAPIRDLLIHLALFKLVQPCWTDEIQEEWIRNLLDKRPDLKAEQLDRTRRLMEEAVPGARVTGYERHIEKLLLPDPNDRHVLAAAIEAGAEAILTFNLRDFPIEVLRPHGITAVHPDTFLSDLLLLQSDSFLAAVRRIRSLLTRPPLSAVAYVEKLRDCGLPLLAEHLQENVEQI